jgi:hypothetical protein
MKRTSTILILTLLLFSCQKENKKVELLKCFVFSKSSEASNYSIKFSDSDTVFLEKHFPAPRQHYFFIIEKSDKDIIKKLVNEIQFSKYDSIYDEYTINHLVDGVGYKFYFQKDTLKNWIYIYGHIGPKEFYDFADLIENLKQKQMLFLTDKQVDFGNLDHILLPEPPPDPTKNHE